MDNWLPNLTKEKRKFKSKSNLRKKNLVKSISPKFGAKLPRSDSQSHPCGGGGGWHAENFIPFERNLTSRLPIGRVPTAWHFGFDVSFPAPAWHCDCGLQDLWTHSRTNSVTCVDVCANQFVTDIVEQLLQHSVLLEQNSINRGFICFHNWLTASNGLNKMRLNGT